MVLLRREHIPAGSFRVEKKGPVLLQAFLGTCVGVALYDEVTKIGGMIHILLPEPPSTMAPQYPEKYASTGLPLLLEELFALGVDPCNLTATIAGGALVAPLSELDIHLDIGEDPRRSPLTPLTGLESKSPSPRPGASSPAPLSLTWQRANLPLNLYPWATRTMNRPSA